ncbi:MAG TPA: hypothetical protein VK427_11165, partial [Kofleriaceae bacterium]|nr:hypothetical protein [Kofleriaceae bacterium]
MSSDGNRPPPSDETGAPTPAGSEVATSVDGEPAAATIVPPAPEAPPSDDSSRLPASDETGAETPIAQSGTPPTASYDDPELATLPVPERAAVAIPYTAAPSTSLRMIPVATAAGPVNTVSSAAALPDPEAAAFEAARIAEQIVGGKFN